MIKKETKTFGLLGKDIAYSFSRGYFSEKFAKLGLQNYSYVNFDINSIAEFKNSIDPIKNLGGINVTIPYKQEVIPFLDVLDETAAEIGAVNTIKILQDRRLKGYNTDAIGFEDSLKPLLQPIHQKALILGTGGASKAIAYVLEKNNIDFKFVSRTPSANNTIAYEAINESIISTYTIIVNCTPLGTSPKTDLAPEIPYSLLTKNHLLYDLIYNPECTVFLSKGKEKGATIKNGFEMLQLQAEASWRIWNI